MYKNISKKPIFDNIRLQAPSGKLVGYINQKRKKWYLNKRLVTEINDNLLVLNFEPNWRGDTHYTKENENMCVVCGATTLLTRHHTVPYMFVKELDKNKARICGIYMLAICASDHYVYEIEAEKIKKNIAETYGVTINGIPQEVYYELITLKTRLGVLRPRRVPSEIIVNAIEYIYNKRHLIDLVNSELIKWDQHPDYINFCRRYCEDRDFDYILSFWKDHFVDTMKPKFMPDWWY